MLNTDPSSHNLGRRIERAIGASEAQTVLRFCGRTESRFGVEPRIKKDLLLLPPPGLAARCPAASGPAAGDSWLQRVCKIVPACCAMPAAC